ncbi:hypothetical protein [Streptomyces sp. S.PB5]|uniref:hypothetical protein n=1 Tax=Streptomyces sp. S.PB5 TaxID=3020844 RepID=UPI0025AFFCB1|nr:hypothetical protein [Streptomyces sp. S.PB5]MDN3028447.1 hypothetical protein [Streptomyces sp. S.PB5]
MRSAPVEQVPSHGTDDGTPWPRRACCCAAPPMVKVLLPTGDHRTVDLFLCGHHYRASLGPLALADASVVFRERPTVLSLDGHR